MFTFILAMSASSRAIVSWKPEASRPMRSSMSLICRSRDSFCGGAEWLKNRTKKIERGRSLRTKERKKGHSGDTHSALERVDLAGVGLDLVSELHGLLPGLLQGLVVLTHRLVQVRHLEGQRSKVRNYRNECDYNLNSKLVGRLSPSTCTSPRPRKCSWQRCPHTGL